MTGSAHNAAQPGRIERLAATEFDAASSLVVEAGWNQVPADWQLFTELGAAFAVHDDSGGLAATAATLPFARFGWISMVLVRKSHRRQGLATALLQHCITHLTQQGRVPVLDATPAGRTVYQPLGFRDGWQITRWRRAHAAAQAAVDANDAAWIRSLRDDDWSHVDELDTAAFGADRAAVLRRLHARSRTFACVAEREGRVIGFLLGRNGRQATQVGPVVTREAAVASALLQHALARITGPVILDAVDAHHELRQQLPVAGFSVERGYTRMALATDAAYGDAHSMVAIAGPELG